jgi:hypothetical protein
MKKAGRPRSLQCGFHGDNLGHDGPHCRRNARVKVTLRFAGASAGRTQTVLRCFEHYVVMENLGRSSKTFDVIDAKEYKPRRR